MRPFRRTLMAPGLWSPAVLGSAVLAWFDSYDVSTFTLSGSFVTQWRSKVGSYTLTPSTANTISRSATARNSRPGVVFNGSDYLSCAATGLPSGTNPVALAILAYSASGSTKGYAMGYDGTGNHRDIDNENSTLGIGFVGNGADLFTHAAWVSDAVVIANIIASGNIDLSYQQSGAGGVTHGTTANNVGTPSTLYVGSSGFLSPHWHDVIQEALILNRAITADERQKLEGYLAWKYGASAALTSAHPYKNAAPTQ